MKTVSLPSPFHLANVAHRMAEHSNGGKSVMFQNVAMVSMGIMAVAATMQVMGPLLRDLNDKHDRHYRGRSC